METAVFMGSGSLESYYAIYNVQTREILSRLFEIPPTLITKDNLKEHQEILRKTTYVFSSWGMPTLSKEKIKIFFPNLKAIFYAAGSVKGFAQPFLQCGVKVFSAWAANAVPVAEFTAAQIVLANKGFFQANEKIRRLGYAQSAAYCRSFKGNYDTHIGLLGAGMVGKEVIRLLKPYRFHIFVYDPFLPEAEAERLGVTLSSLEEIFSSCDVISNHLADNAQTRGLLDKALFSRMGDYATFINTGRGAQVVEVDLAEALREKSGRTALLDVTDPEPPRPENPFFALDNVFLTPHIAGSMNCETQRMGEYMCEECLAFVNGQKTRYEVTEEMLKTMA